MTNGQAPVAVVSMALMANGEMQFQTQGGNLLQHLGMLELMKVNLIARQQQKQGPKVEVAPPGMRLG